MNTVAKIGRVLLADDHVPILAQTMNLLASEFEIVGSVGNGLDLVDVAARLDPDVVVLDITMPGCDGIEAARRLKRVGCRAHLVFLTVHEDPDYVHAALDAGGVAYVAKADWPRSHPSHPRHPGGTTLPVAQLGSGRKP